MNGMTYKILPTKEFSKDFSKLDNSVKKRLKNKLEEVAIDPTRYKHLSYDLKGSCRIRIGKLRIIFSYSEKLKELYLEKIVFDHNYRE
ncbi:MAG: hypothetical protein QT09_C0017G0017 [archaeon GW2011_AR18]|nr:MAG: hypothetical protein QT09_C0017G0017 [archaeon GW2011_AR18]